MKSKKIAIIDEQGFCRICSALFDSIGYGAETLPSMASLPSSITTEDFGLVVMSYPYAAPLIDQIKNRNIPTIILSDNIDGSLLTILDDFEHSYCMIKPLDYEQFRSLVKEVMSGKIAPHGGYELV